MTWTPRAPGTASGTTTPPTSRENTTAVRGTSQSRRAASPRCRDDSRRPLTRRIRRVARSSATMPCLAAPRPRLDCWASCTAGLLAELLGQGDDDALGAADVAEQVFVLVLHHLADEFSAVCPQTGKDVPRCRQRRT